MIHGSCQSGEASDGLVRSSYKTWPKGVGRGCRDGVVVSMAVRATETFETRIVQAQKRPSFHLDVLQMLVQQVQNNHAHTRLE